MSRRRSPASIGSAWDPGTSVWSSDSASAVAVAKRIQAGAVWINQHGALHPMVPFGGVKRSGCGASSGWTG
ncbi:aldehyde dehydrogenase family protein [Variovorax sp. efr-133-TYG-130]|uniref:aldehyde dehydrogenase family protein n=1 Tax=Variovorax sp. efr-133-TYG-130 TaxID=3040327 RepID=UPI002553368D|nr:aldehyde dehydrogenase family protein [Variovorax sp. efr-133-TYG-130]